MDASLRDLLATNAEGVRAFWDVRRVSTDVALVSGGRSVEDRRFLDGAPRDRVSRYSLEDSLVRLGIPHHVVEPTSRDFVRRLTAADVVLVNLHGEFGEDGRLQGLLDWLDVPYTHSGVRASAVAQHKPTAKRLATALGVLTPEWFVVPGSSACTVRPPAVCKPASGGSSVALTLSLSGPELATGIAAARESDVDGEALVERFVDGTHVTVGIVELLEGVVALPPLDVRSSEGLYGERTKHGTDLDVKIDYACPARVPPSVGRRLQAESLLFFQALGCRGVVRVDWVVDAQNRPFFLELNVVPGLSTSSNVACAAEVAGLRYDDLVAAVLALPLLPKPSGPKPVLLCEP